MIPNITVFVVSSSLKLPPEDNPSIIHLTDPTYIYLSSRDRYYSQYVYQFSHEICHYIINCSYFFNNDRFGWFEESICELASLYVLNKLSKTRLNKPPIANGQTFAPNHANYINNRLQNNDLEINVCFKEWLQQNLPQLYIDRYKRTENTIIASKLLTIFEKSPELWKTIQYLKDVQVNISMSFEDFLNAWISNLPEILKQEFPKITSVLITN